MKLRDLLSASRMWVKADLLLSSTLLQAIVILFLTQTPLGTEDTVEVTLVNNTINNNNKKTERNLAGGCTLNDVKKCACMHLRSFCVKNYAHEHVHALLVKGKHRCVCVLFSDLLETIDLGWKTSGAVSQGLKSRMTHFQGSFKADTKRLTLYGINRKSSKCILETRSVTS